MVPLDSCQMLIKAKERKTLVSACGGCRKPRNMFLTPSLSFSLSPASFSLVASCFCVRLRLHRRRWSMYRGPVQLVEARVPRIFIPRELRTALQPLPVVRRYERPSMLSRGYSVPRAPAAVTSATLPSACWPAGGG